MRGDKIVIIVFILLALLLNVGGIGKSAVVYGIKTGALTVFYPLQWLSGSVIGRTAGFFRSVKDSKSLSRENQKLREENSLLQMELLGLNSLRSENMALRNSFSGRHKIPGYFSKLVFAQIIGRSNDLWNSYIILDCGKNEGIKEGAAVICPEGLVGRIVSSDPLTSKVQLLLDVKSSVTIRTQKSRIEALAAGEGGDFLHLKYVPAGSDLFIGEMVAVSQSSDLLPGIPVGYVSKIKGSDVGLFKNIEITPAVDFSKLDVVYVVLQ